ncbi:transposase tnp2 [Tanacetum coccineum]
MVCIEGDEIYSEEDGCIDNLVYLLCFWLVSARFLGKLKKKVTNKAKVESSIANAYLIEETSMFCSHYFEPHVKTKLNRVPRNDNGGDEELYEGTIYVFISSG